ncbi:MAG: beta-ketoacyl-[acyl-carrier-protein] synthase family protein [Dehalococcoidia bacterium]
MEQVTPHGGERIATVITGAGAITPLGLDAAAFWRACVEGRSGVRAIAAFDATAFPCRVAGEAWGFDPLARMSRKEAGRAARFVQLAVAAAAEAWERAGLDGASIDGARLGVVWGSGSGGASAMDAVLGAALNGGWSACEPLALLKVLPDSAANALAVRFGAHGHVSTVVAACVSSTLAVVEAVRLIRAGVVDIAVAGGSEAWITPLGIGSFCLLRALSTARNDAPETASRPFDRTRDGFVPAEGAGAVVIESAEHAARRGATAIAVIAGVGVTNDAHHAVAPHPDGVQAARAITLALEDAGMRAEDIGYVNAHGTSTVLNDVAETKALKLALGEHAYRVPVSATKSMTGHGLGASGAWETIVTACALRDGIVHPTINLGEPDPACDLDYVREGARRTPLRTALKTSFGFGGQNAALVLRAAG